MKVTTEYEDGKLVRQATVAQAAGGGYTISEIRCNCDVPTVSCSLHGKQAEEPPT